MSQQSPLFESIHTIRCPLFDLGFAIRLKKIPSKSIFKLAFGKRMPRLPKNKLSRSVFFSLLHFFLLFLILVLSTGSVAIGGFAIIELFYSLVLFFIIQE